MVDEEYIKLLEERCEKLEEFNYFLRTKNDDLQDCIRKFESFPFNTSLSQIITHSLKTRPDPTKCSINDWFREYVLIRLHCGRQRGHSSAVIDVLPSIFKNVWFVYPNLHTSTRHACVKPGCEFFPITNLESKTRGYSAPNCVVFDEVYPPDFGILKEMAYKNKDFTVILVGTCNASGQ